MCLFFFEDLERVYKSWDKRLSSVPVVDKPIESEIVSSEWLKEFGEWAIIDEAVRAYPGTYTHRDIERLPVIDVYRMIYYSRRAAAHHAQLNQVAKDIK